MIPAEDLALMRSHPQKSDVYLIIQQPERHTEAEYPGWQHWVDYVWSCRIFAEPVTDPVYNLSVANSSGNATLLDGMTVFIGSSEYGEWNKGIVRLRGDQTVNAGTNLIDIAPMSEFRGRVKKNDYVVVLDEFRLWQRFSRVELVADIPLWYKDWTIRWIHIAANDAARRLAMLPPVPIMGTHGVKFLDPPEVNSQFWFDWSNSYAVAAGAAMATWTSWGEQDHVGNVWNSAAQVPGWQVTKGISGLRGFRTVLEVNDGNGTATTLPFRRGVRYMFTLRRPGQSQPGDPANAEPITEFAINGDIAASFDQGYWRTSITVFHDAVSKYLILPGALVILFTEDWNTEGSPYLAPTGIRKVSVGPIFDRENILMVGRIADSSIHVDPQTGDVTFDVYSTGEEAAAYENVPIVVNDKIDSTEWIDVPNLTVDRAVHMYRAWHTTLSLVADVYQTGDTHTLYAMDFTAGSIYSTLDSFLRDRLFARMLFDKYGRCFCQVDAQFQPFGTVPTQFTLGDGDWLDEINIKHYETSRCKAAEVGGVVYFGGAVTPKLARAPGSFDMYRGVLEASNSLAITSQAELNIIAGRFLEGKNYEYEMGINLAGFWPYMDIAPQGAVYLNGFDSHRGTIAGRQLIRAVVNAHHEVGCNFTSIQTEDEKNDGFPGVTIVVPDELPKIPPPNPHDGKPWDPPTGEDSGRRIIATDVGVFACDNIEATTPYWYAVNSGFTTANDRYVYDIKRDPYHWWTSATERTLWAVNRTGIWKHENFPYGTWICQITYAQLMAKMGYSDATCACPWVAKGRINLSIELDGRYAVACNLPDKTNGGWPVWWERTAVFVCQAAAIINGTELCADGSGMGVCCGSDSTPGWPDVAFAQHHGTQQIYATSARTWNNAGFAVFRLWRTNNGAAAVPVWATVDGPYDFWNGGPYTSVAVPYDTATNTDLYVYWTAGQSAGAVNTARRTANGGATFADIPSARGGWNKIRDGLRYYRMFILGAYPASTACKWTNDNAVTWNTYPIPVMGGGLESVDSFVVWNGDTISSVLIGGFPTGAPPATGVIYYWLWGTAAWTNKTGNLISAYTVGIVHAIDRDSSGSA